MTEARDFWSRRKAGVAAEAQAEDDAAERRTIEAGQAEKSDEDILTELGLPDPDALGAGDDFSAFMAKAVPDRLRTRALRKLWLTNPVLANVDGLVDYGEDFTDAACVIENMQTSYQVGKGMRAHVEEMARQAELDAANAEATDGDAGNDAEDAGEDAVDEVEPDADLMADAPEDNPQEVALTNAPMAQEDAMPDPEDGPVPRRRMHFRFDQPDREGAHV